MRQSDFVLVTTGAAQQFKAVSCFMGDAFKKLAGFTAAVLGKQANIHAYKRFNFRHKFLNWRYICTSRQYIILAQSRTAAKSTKRILKPVDRLFCRRYYQPIIVLCI